MIDTVASASPYQRLADATAHEVRNALNAMAIHLAVLAEQARDPTGAAPKHSVAALQAQVGRIEAIMRRFQLLASPPEDEGEVELLELVSQTLEACGHEARRCGVVFETDLQPARVKGWVPELTEAILFAVLHAIEQSRGRSCQVRLEARGKEVQLTLCAPGSAPAEASVELRWPLAG